MAYSGKRIRHARLMKGYSMQQLADRPGVEVTKQSIHKYESGQSRPSHKVLRRLAHALDVKIDYFYRDEPLEMDEIQFRKLSSLRKKEQNRIIETARDQLERYLELERLLGLESNVNNPIRDWIVHDEEDVEEVARRLREAWQLGTDPLHNLTELLEDQGIKIIWIDADDDFDGASTWIQNRIPVIVLKRPFIEPDNNNLDRYRFTLLLELGHLLLQIADDNLHHRTLEKWCNRFAGAMLLDQSALRTEMGTAKRKQLGLQELAAIKQQYGISIQAIVYRLRDLNIISDSAYQQFWKFVSQYGLKKDESSVAVYEGPEEALRFNQLISHAVAEQQISVSKAAELKGISVAEFYDAFLLKPEPEA